MTDSAEATLAAVLEALTLQPCHTTGMHSPDHHLNFVCDIQRSDMLTRVLKALDLREPDLPRALHGDDCYWCHHVPSEEHYREKLRKSHEWAGVTVPPELAAPAPDVPQEGDTELVYSALTDDYEPWQAVTRRIEPRMALRRYWAAVHDLQDAGRAETYDISARRTPVRAMVR